jgi:hypothetical protein
MITNYLLFYLKKQEKIICVNKDDLTKTGAAETSVKEEVSISVVYEQLVYNYHRIKTNCI